MKKITFISVVLLVCSQLQGCIGVFAAGAASTAVVVTDPRTTDEQVKDQRIEMEVQSLVDVKKYKEAENFRLNFVSYGADLMIVGQVENKDLLQSFIIDAKKIKGIGSVYNKVELKKEITSSQIASDTWITTKVKTKMITKDKLSSHSIKVLTEDNVVYLMGYITHAQAKLAVDIARNVSGVKLVVTAFEFID